MNIDILLKNAVVGSQKSDRSLTFKQWELLIECLRENALLARFSYHLKKSGELDIPSGVAQHLHSELVRAARQKQQALYECKLIDKHLRAIGVKPVFLKGAAYSISNSPVSFGRLYGDIDVLVAKHEIDKSKQALLERGWFPQTLTDYDEMYYREWAHEIPPLTHTKRGTVLDLHHNLVPLVSGQAPNVLDFTQDVIETSDRLRVFSPAVQTLHSAVHLFLNEDFSHGFRDLTDLHILFTANKGNDEYWTRLLSLAETSSFEKELQLAMRYCKRLLGTEIPLEHYKHSLAMKKMRFTLLDFLFEPVLTLRHPALNMSRRNICELAVYIRGHFLKMPVGVLIKHLLTKGWRSAVESMLGKNFYDNEHNAN